MREATDRTTSSRDRERSFVVELVDLGQGLGGLRVDDEKAVEPTPVCAPAGAPVHAPSPGDLWVAQPSREGEGELLLVGDRLAQRGSVRAQLVRIAAASGVPFLHGPDAMAETQAFVEIDGIDEPSLEDFTQLPFVTIDNVDSRDLDQAVHVESLADGNGYVVRYALADASYYVGPGSALFAEALERGASYYLPGFSLPMLPRELSEGLVSLNPQVSRRAMVFEMVLDPAGMNVRTRVVRGRVRSVAKLSYDEVQAYYDEGDQHDLAGRPFRTSLDLLAEVGRLRIKAARERNVVHFARVEVEVEPTDPEGMTFEIMGTHRLEVELYNEQISLMCNVEGALWLTRHAGESHVQPIFRAHPAPTAERQDALAELIDAVVAEQRLDPSVWSWNRRGSSPQSLADYLDHLPRERSTRSIRAAIERQVLLVNQRSMFQAEPEGHYGVGAPAYARFSSPMREVVGVFTHKEAVDLLEDRGAGEDPSADLALRERVIASANRAKDLQRELTKACNKVVLDQVFGRDLGSPTPVWRAGTILGVTRSRLYVRLHDPPVEVKVYVCFLAPSPEASCDVDPHDIKLVVETHGARQIYRAGDEVAVAVTGYEDGTGRWRFAVAYEQP